MRALATVLLVAAIGGNSIEAIAQSCGCRVSDRKEAAYDALLNLDNSEAATAIATHLPWGISAPPVTERVLHQEHYITSYDTELRVPIWVAYRLRDDDLSVDRARTECFRRDPRLQSNEAAFCEDYDEPIFDRGHMVPNASMERTEAAMINTYMFSNMVPQHDEFNRGHWARLESHVRKWAERFGEIYVISGAIFDLDGDGQRDANIDARSVAPRNRVAIPTHFYKIIIRDRPNEPVESMTFLLEHVDTSPDGAVAKDALLTQSLTTIDTIEALTGIDFLQSRQPNTGRSEAAIEGFRAVAMWPR